MQSETKKLKQLFTVTIYTKQLSSCSFYMWATEMDVHCEGS